MGLEAGAGEGKQKEEKEKPHAPNLTIKLRLASPFPEFFRSPYFRTAATAVVPSATSIGRHRLATGTPSFSSLSIKSSPTVRPA